MRKGQEFKNIWNSVVKRQAKETQLLESQEMPSPSRTAIKQSLFVGELQASSEENHEQLNHYSSCQYSSLEVSLEEQILDQHLPSLKSSIFRIWDKLLAFAFRNDSLASFHTEEIEHLQKFTDYLRYGKSLIPSYQLPSLLHALGKNNNLRTALEWIYNHIQPQLGDELILAAHRVLLAFSPVRQLCDNMQTILSISTIPFNVFNIFGDHSFKVLNYAQLYEVQPGSIQKNCDLLAFYHSFITTIILISEEYFNNPFYKLQVADAIRKKQNRCGFPKKRKLIHK